MWTKVYRSCRWLVEKLTEKRRMSYEEINSLWMLEDTISGGAELNKRTFHRYRTYLRDIFGIEVVCRERGDYAYYIKSLDLLKDDSLPLWMLNTLAVDEKLRSCLHIKDRIRLENVPSGGEKLEMIFQAMSEGRILNVEHLKYEKPDLKLFSLMPYCAVLHNQRWYVLGKLDNGKLYTFAIDRMKKVEVSDKKFIMDKNFSTADYFDDIIGIYNSGREKLRVVFRAFGSEPSYLRDLPLHRSQKEIGIGDGYSDFMIEVVPNNELIASLLYRRDRVKVLSPTSIVEEMKAAATTIKNLYE